MLKYNDFKLTKFVSSLEFSINNIATNQYKLKIKWQRISSQAP